MSHNEPRTHWVREGLISLGTGVLYGSTYVAVAHPFDTIKTKMQAQTGFERLNIFQTLVRTVKTDGFRGLYRGCIPPLWGSSIYRSIQFASFEATYTLLDDPFWKKEIPLTGGLQFRVIAGGLASGSTRALIECPLEYAKIKRQINQSWRLKDVYTGYTSVTIRCVPLMTCYFIIVDSLRRNFPNAFTFPVVGPMFTSGFAAMSAWWCVWPLEYVRTQLQAGYGGPKEPVWRRLRKLFSSVGFFGLYRGMLAGSLRSFTGAGTAMVVMLAAQKKATDLGLRDKKD